MDNNNTSSLQEPLNKVLDMLHSSAKAYTQLHTYQEGDKNHDCLCNISSRREKLAEELEEQMSKEGILIDKRVEASTRHTFPGRENEIDAIHSYSAMDQKLIEQYEELNRSKLSNEMSELISDHITNFKADQKEVSNLT